MSGRERPFSAAAVAVLIAVGVFAFSAFFVLSAYAPALRGGNDGNAHALSRSAVGYAALADLLARTGTPVILSRQAPFSEPADAMTGRGADGPLTVLTPARLGDLDLGVPSADSPVLIVLPKWRTGADPDREGWIVLGPPVGRADLAFDVAGHRIALTVRRRGDRALPVRGPRPVGDGREDDSDGSAEGAGAAPNTDAEGDEGDGAERDGGSLEDRLERLGVDLSGPGRFVRTVRTDAEDIALNPPGLLFGPRTGPVPAPSRIEDVMSLQTVSGEHVSPVWTDAYGRIVLGRVTVHPPAEDGPDVTGYAPSQAYVLADPDLLNTMGLASPANARAAVDLVGALAGDRPVRFDLTAFGFSRPRNLLTLALEPPFLAASLAGLLAAALMALHATARSGPPAGEPVGFALGKAALADNTAAMLAASDKARTLGPRYAGLVRARIADALGVPRGAEDRIDEAARRALGTDALEQATRNARTEDEAAMLLAARRLHEIQERTRR